MDSLTKENHHSSRLQSEHIFFALLEIRRKTLYRILIYYGSYLVEYWPNERLKGINI